MHDKRRNELKQWVTHELTTETLELSPMSGDASFRRYFRVQLPQGSVIAVDSPPERENNLAFVKVAESLHQIGVNVPQIHAYDLKQGFLILSDLGDDLYLSILKEDNATSLYHAAIDALIRIQKCHHFNSWQLPTYSAKMFAQENHLFLNWFLTQQLSLNLSHKTESMIKEVFDKLIDNALKQPHVCVHRDYHSRNLMFCSKHNPGVIDFQGAVYGPITYDLASLFSDSYIGWPEGKVRAWLQYYQQQALSSGLLIESQLQHFDTWYDWMCVQRNMKAIGIFCRLAIRDQKLGYLEDIPRTLGHIVRSSNKHVVLQPLAQFIQNDILPRLNQEAVI